MDLVELIIRLLQLLQHFMPAGVRRNSVLLLFLEWGIDSVESLTNCLLQPGFASNRRVDQHNTKRRSVQTGLHTYNNRCRLLRVFYSFIPEAVAPSMSVYVVSVPDMCPQLTATTSQVCPT